MLESQPVGAARRIWNGRDMLPGRVEGPLTRKMVSASLHFPNLPGAASRLLSSFRQVKIQCIFRKSRRLISASVTNQKYNGRSSGYEGNGLEVDPEGGWQERKVDFWNLRYAIDDVGCKKILSDPYKVRKLVERIVYGSSNARIPFLQKEKTRNQSGRFFRAS